MSSLIAAEQLQSIRIRAAAEKERRTRLLSDYHSYINRVNPKFEWWKHAEALASVMWRIVRKELTRVMFFMPPRHGKSEMGSKILPSAWLSAHPTEWVGITSYGDTLAKKMSRAARSYYKRGGGELNPAISGVQEWENMFGGGCWEAGVGGSITGRGYNLGIIDDPLKNPEEAESIVVTDSQIDWYDTVFLKSAEPHASIVLIMHRWSQRDLAGYILSKAEERNEPWHIVVMDALKSDARLDIPKNCTQEPDWRSIGEALCPERYTADDLKARKKTISPKYWNSLYQQRPVEESGEIWKRDWFKGKTFKLGTQPELTNIGKDWDAAYTKKEKNSASGYIESGRDENGDLWITGMDFKWLEFPELIKWMRSVGGPHHVEAKASGKSIVQTLKSYRLYAQEVPVEGGNDKVARAKLATPAAELGHVHVAEHIISRLLDDDKQGILRFPNGEHDDVNDMLVQAINRLFKKGRFVWGVA